MTADGGMVFQDNIDVLLLEFIRDEGQVDIFPDEFFFLWSKLFSVLLEVLFNIAKYRSDVVKGDLIGCAVLEVFGVTNRLVACEL